PARGPLQRRRPWAPVAPLLIAGLGLGALLAQLFDLVLEAVDLLAGAGQSRPGAATMADNLLGGLAGGEHLHRSAAVTIDGHNLAPQLEGLDVDLAHILLCGLVREIAGLGDRRVDVLLEGGLHPDMPFGG